ncbi:MAG: hypothetical protein ACTSVY_04410 [Candidatus Helarchaeota archaeon]
MNITNYFDDWMNSWAQWGWFGVTIIFVILVSMIIIGFLLIAMRYYGDLPIKLIISGMLLLVLFNIIFASLFGFNFQGFLQWYFQEFFKI